jgi:phosphate transport system protein
MMIMRKLFHERLDQLAAQLDDMVVLVEKAMRDATTALFAADPAVAESVITGHGDVRARQAAVDETALELLAREQPVAGDLRTIVACLRMSTDLRRMGKLAVHVAEIARDRDPATPVPAPLWETARSMSDRALALVAQAVAAGDAASAALLEHDDDQVDQLQQELYRRLLAGTPGVAVEVAVELALIGRYYERYADHAVDLGRGVAYLTGGNALDATVGTV